MAGNAISHNLSGCPNLRYGKSYFRPASTDRGVPVNMITQFSLGAPTTAAANNVAASQSVVVATTPLAVINGSLASGGVATLDVPRNVVAAWTGAAVVTVTGTDQYGVVINEASASGTSLTGKKAFKTVTAVSFSANVTAATVGTGVLLGLPYALSSAADILSKYADAVPDTTGTVAVAVTTDPATTTTGDVRGTISFASAPNSSRVYKVWAKFDPTSATTLYGVAQA